MERQPERRRKQKPGKNGGVGFFHTPEENKKMAISPDFRSSKCWIYQQPRRWVWQIHCLLRQVFSVLGKPTFKIHQHPRIGPEEGGYEQHNNKTKQQLDELHSVRLVAGRRVSTGLETRKREFLFLLNVRCWAGWLSMI